MDFWSILLCEISQTEKDKSQSYLGDTVGFLPNYHNKTNFTIVRVTLIFWFPSQHKNYISTILYTVKYATALCLKWQCKCLNIKKERIYVYL